MTFLPSHSSSQSHPQSSSPVGFWESFVFSYRMKNFLFQIFEKYYWYFDGDCTNLQIVLVIMALFTILILPIHKQGISFHLLVSSLISLVNVLEFSEYISFASLGKITLVLFTVFDGMVNGIVSIQCIECSRSLFTNFASPSQF